MTAEKPLPPRPLRIGEQFVPGRGIIPIPPVAKSGDETRRQADAVNSKPIDLALLAPEPWQYCGGGSAFKWNGYAVTRRRWK
jgi:hypothetical protein